MSDIYSYQTHGLYKTMEGQVKITRKGDYGATFISDKDENGDSSLLELAFVLLKWERILVVLL